MADVSAVLHVWFCLFWPILIDQITHALIEWIVTADQEQLAIEAYLP